MRILIAGTSGSGKTTFAQRLGAILGIPHTEMDPSAQKPTNVPSTHAYRGPVKPPKVSVIVHPRSLASFRGASRMNSRRRIRGLQNGSTLRYVSVF